MRPAALRTATILGVAPAALIAVLALVLSGGCAAGSSGGTPPPGTPFSGNSSTSGSNPQPVTTSPFPEQIGPTTAYVALVEDGLEPQVAPLLQGYQARGVDVALVPLSHVTAWGRDRAEEIRNWLLAQCNDGVARALLLAGGPGAIPFRTCEPAAAVGPVVCDLYYGDLQGDWDANGNGVFGELQGDRPSFDALMTVGRIPYDDPADVATAVGAIENARTNKGPWSSGCLLVAGTILVPGDAPLGAETIRTAVFGPQGWAIETAYPSGSLIPGDTALTPTTVVSRLAADPRALLFVISHGSTQALASHDPGGWSAILTTADLPALPKDRPPVLVAAACDSGDPSGGPCLGSLALKNGLAGFVGATVVVNPLSGGGAGFMAEFDVASGIAAGMPLGIALRDTIRNYVATGLAATGSDASARAEVYREAMSGILYGDPALRIGPRAP